MKFKTAKAAICNAFLQGEKLTILDCFRKFGVSNSPREVRRMIEKPFDVIIERVDKQGLTRFRHTCNYKEYSLAHNKRNKQGIQRMLEYVNKNIVCKKIG